MKKIILSLLIVFVASYCYPQKVVKVTNVIELIKAIASNTTIELSIGRYNLSKATHTINSNVDWETEEGKKYDPLITNVNNLTIKGVEKVEIVIDATDGAVLNFRKCSNITFQNLIIGHTNNGGCDSPVLVFRDVDSVFINNCELYGSGTAGFDLYNVNYLSFNNSMIRNCSINLLKIGYSKNIYFKKSEFKETGNESLF